MSRANNANRNIGATRFGHSYGETVGRPQSNRRLSATWKRSSSLLTHDNRSKHLPPLPVAMTVSVIRAVFALQHLHPLMVWGVRRDMSCTLHVRLTHGQVDMELGLGAALRVVRASCRGTVLGATRGGRPCGRSGRGRSGRGRSGCGRSTPRGSPTTIPGLRSVASPPNPAAREPARSRSAGLRTPCGPRLRRWV